LCYYALLFPVSHEEETSGAIMSVRRLWNELLGRRMTRRLKDFLLPDLVWNQEIYGSLLQRYVSERVRWLDAGCGWRILGEDLENIENSLAETAGMVVGTDLEFGALAKHRNITRRVCATLDALPFPDQAFDLVTCNMVVEHLADPKTSLGEMVRLVSPNGRLVIHTPNLLNYLVFANHIVGKMLPRKLVLRLVQASDKRGESDIFPTYYRANSVTKLRQLFEAFSLRLESTRILTSPQPYFRFFAPLAFLELLWMRITMSWIPDFGATILVVSRVPKEATAPAHSVAA
jgi:2-polyprenyl-3-methyl-5-hydroxy-6-metoxy-1,4-benzoquinol methylase